MSKKRNDDIVTTDQSALDHQYQLDHQMVKGVFRNLTQKGSPVRFAFRKYKKDPIKWYPQDINGKPNYFVDGRTYEVPLMIANHLNTKCYREIHQNGMDANGIPLPETMIGEKKQRFMFVNTDFRPIKGWEEPSQIVKVTQSIIT